MAKILIVEDEVSLARAMGDALADAGHQVKLVHVGEKAMAEFAEFAPDLALLDVRLGGVNGLDLLEQIKERTPGTEVVVVTAFGSVQVAVDAMKRGAADFLTKPIDLDVLTVTVDKLWAASQQRRRLEQFQSAQAEQLSRFELLGRCDAIQEIREQVERFAQRSAVAGRDLPAILLTGETGTGKDLLARCVHAALTARTGPFVALNCNAVPSELFESELFGHQRGAFSGSTADKPGLFETADGGTLFLDEIGDLPDTLQPKLLRAIETHTIRRVGDVRDRGVDVLLIAATHRDLTARVQEGRFRKDLYYRLKVLTIELPPLRSRGDDILLLADHFSQQLAIKYGLPDLTLSKGARQALRDHDWPGNVRELQHALESAVLTSRDATIEPADLPLAAPDPLGAAERAVEDGRPICLEEVERRLVEKALRRTGGNVSAAARLLSIGREALRYRMAKFERPQDDQLQ